MRAVGTEPEHLSMTLAIDVCCPSLCAQRGCNYRAQGALGRERSAQPRFGWAALPDIRCFQTDPTPDGLTRSG